MSFLYLPLLVHFAAFGQSDNTEVLIRELNTTIERLERQERAQSDILAANRHKFTRLRELQQLTQNASAYSATASRNQLEMQQLETNLNYLKPVLRETDEKIRQTERRIVEIGYQVKDLGYQKRLSPTHIQSISSSGRFILEDIPVRALYPQPKTTEEIAELLAGSRDARLAPKAKYKDQLDPSPYNFSMIKSNSGARAQAVPGTYYYVTLQTGGEIRGHFRGVENGRLVFEYGHPHAWIGEAKSFITVKPSEIMNFEVVSSKANPMLWEKSRGRFVRYTDNEIKQAIQTDGIRSLLEPRKSDAAQNPARTPFRTTIQTLSPLFDGAPPAVY